MNDDDWLKVERPDDWLSTDPVVKLPAVFTRPAISSSLVKIPETSEAQLHALHEAWDRLTPIQQHVIVAWESARWNLRATIKALESTPDSVARTTVYRDWMSQRDFGLVVKILRADAAKLTLDTDHLLLRQDDIVEQLMTPQPVLHMGQPTGFFENRAPAASKANETLMKVAGLLKGDEHTTRHVVRFVNLAGPEVQQAVEVATEIT